MYSGVFYIETIATVEEYCYSINTIFILVVKHQAVVEAELHLKK